MTPPTKIIIANDYNIISEGLKQVIAETADMCVAAEAADGPELLAKIRNDEFDLLILVIPLPGCSELDILTEIKGIRPNLPVLVMGMQPEELYALRVLKTGAAGYLPILSSQLELIKAFKTIALGRKYVSGTVAEILANRFATNMDGPPHVCLSDREFLVMRMIAAGTTPKKIAEELQINVKTINTYRMRIMQKLKMRRNADLTRYAMQHNLL